MKRSVLLTAAKEDTEVFRSSLDELDFSLLHYPLERYQKIEADESVLNAFQQLDSFENIVHGSKRNARFFIEKVKELDKLEEARDRLNLALTQYTADYLEEEGIPAVHPESGGKAINLMEFMLRIKRLGETLYPCGDKTKEELPGFLQELDIPVQELVLFTLEGPLEEDLQKYQKDIAAHNPEFVIFHSRRAVNRTLAAFPNVDFGSAQVISGNQGTTEHLKDSDIAPDLQAEGSWDSILEKLTEVTVR